MHVVGAVRTLQRRQRAQRQANGGRHHEHDRYHRYHLNTPAAVLKLCHLKWFMLDIQQYVDADDEDNRDEIMTSSTDKYW